MQTNYSNISSLHERKEKIKIKFEIILESFFVALVFSEYGKKIERIYNFRQLKKMDTKKFTKQWEKTNSLFNFFLHLARKVQVFKIPSKIKRNFVLIYKELEPNYNNNVM